MMRKLLILLLLAGCAPLTRPQAKSLVPEGITSEVGGIQSGAILGQTASVSMSISIG